MRFFVLLLFVALAGFASPPAPAQNPAAQQDAEAAREKLLKAEDQLDNIQANSETTKSAVDGMKTDVAQLQATVTKLQTDNAALRQRVADLQAAFDAFKAEQIKARQTLIDNVAEMIAAAKSSSPAKSSRKKKEAPENSTSALDPAPKPDSGPVKLPPATTAQTASLAPPPDSSQAAPGASSDDIAPPAPPPPKPQKGYYHVVAPGETLKLICEAYRDNGVSTSMAAIRKANGLTEKSVLKVGQKLFIPKPGT